MKSYIKPIISDLVFIILTSIIGVYSLIKVKSYLFLIQSFQPEFENLGNKLAENATEFDFTTLAANLEIINKVISNIKIIFVIAIALIFIIFCITQSYSYFKRFNKEYLHYLKRFVIISVPCFALTGILVYNILAASKDFILPFWFENTTTTSSLVYIIIFLLILILELHFFSLTFSYSINHNLKLTIKKSLKELRNIKLFLKFVAVFVAVIIILLIALRYFSIIPQIISLIIILVIINYYRNILPR